MLSPGLKTANLEQRAEKTGEEISWLLTIRWKLVPFKNGDAEDVLVKVFNVKLTVEVPLGVQRVVERPGCEDLSSHGHFAVRVTLTWRTTWRQVSRGRKGRWRKEEEGREKRDEENWKENRKKKWGGREIRTIRKWGKMKGASQKLNRMKILHYGSLTSIEVPERPPTESNLMKKGMTGHHN